jgi:hypothetical protein
MNRYDLLGKIYYFLHRARDIECVFWIKEQILTLSYVWFIRNEKKAQSQQNRNESRADLSLSRVSLPLQ